MLVACALANLPTLAQQILAQKTSGIAPMGIHFTVRDTTWSLIKDSDYEWIFPEGDTVIGFQAVHIFMDEGWVSLKSTRADNTLFIDPVYISVTTADICEILIILSDKRQSAYASSGIAEEA